MGEFRQRMYYFPDYDRVKKIIDEARKEFPDFGKLTNITVSRFEVACQDWFMKWFND